MTLSARFSEAFWAAHARQPDRRHIEIMRDLCDQQADGGMYIGGHWRVRLALQLAQAEREFVAGLGLAMAGSCEGV